MRKAAGMILKNSKFKYSKAREAILDAILSGNLEQDSNLPSEKTLCSQLGVSRITLRAALHELEEAGIIIKRNGRPSRIDQAALQKMRNPLRRIAWVDTSPVDQSNPIYFDIFRSVSEDAAARNVKLDYISLTINALAENFFPKQQEYDGLILGQFTAKYRHCLTRIRHPNCISADCPVPGIAHCVKTDCYLGGRLAARALLETGHRRPAILRFGSRNPYYYAPLEERFRGFRDALAEAGIPLAKKRILNVRTAEEALRFSDFLKENLAVLRDSDSFFVMADSFAVSALYALPDLGIRIPADLSLIGFDGLMLSGFVSPHLTTIRQPVREIGRKLLEIVLNPSESASYPAIIQISPELQSGETLRNRTEKIYTIKTKRRKGS